MKLLEDIYKGAFFARRDRLAWRAPIVCGAIHKVIAPRHVIDVGCAIGEYVAYFIKMGIDAWGLEGSKNAIPFLKVPAERVFIRDLRKPVRVGGHYDLALCLEVLEHVESWAADILVGNLTVMAPRILVSAAPPGQGGHHHVNCQPKSYWVGKFTQRGYIHDALIEDEIRRLWEPCRHKKEMSAYYNNLLFFRRDGVNARCRDDRN